MRRVSSPKGAELLPATGSAATAGAPLRELAAGFGIGVVVAALFYSPLLFGGALHGYDWSSHHWNYFDWVRVSLSEFRTLPLFMNDAWITKNFLANAESPSLGPLVPLLLFLPTGAYIKLLLVVFSAAGFAGLFFLLRDVAVRREIAGFAALVFAFNGFFVAHLSVGHPWAMGAQLLPGLVCSYRRAALGSGRALWLAAVLNACAILGGQHQPFVWQNLLLGLLALLWAIRARALFPIRRLALVVLATAGLAAVKLLPMLAEFADYAPTARIEGLPLALLLPTLLAGGQHPEWQVPGLVYAHGSGWWEYAFYVGPIALGCLAAGAALSRRCWPLLAIAALFFVLAVDWPSPLRGLHIWPWLENLPIWRTQRGPSRFLFLALFGFLVAAAVGLERLWDRDFARWPRAASGAALALCVLVAADLYAASLPWQRAAVGDALASRDHRPRPLVLGAPGAVTAELREFAPNRLVYRASAARPGRLVFPFRYGKGAPEWRIDGLPAVSERGKLAVDVPIGERDIVMVYRPRLFAAGFASSALTLGCVAGTALWRRRRPPEDRKE
ncbi:MAG: hypothetical protein OEM05_01360 [Myxococcales bacterium]|nr:hypothetical protein [Myxococcales bacterium]